MGNLVCLFGLFHPFLTINPELHPAAHSSPQALLLFALACGRAPSAFPTHPACRWFLPLGCKRQGSVYQPPAWLWALLRGVLRHERTVLQLLDPRNNPFPAAPPRMVRTRVVAFSFPDEARSGVEQPYWSSVDLPMRGKWDTTALCLQMAVEECEAEDRS